MKIERISENQIRCTLTREDLTSREIRLSELTYGSEKTKLLFHDMMQQAFLDCGFEANNTPLMIEAIPLSMDSIILIITKVEDPEELDSRFSRFSSDEGGDSWGQENTNASLTGVDDILDLITKLSQIRREAAKKSESAPESAGGQDISSAGSEGTSAAGTETQQTDSPIRVSRFYLFRDLEVIIRCAHALDPSYDGSSTLFKNPDDNNYYLILKMDDTPADLFNKICNELSEYGLQVDYMNGIEQLFTEHMDRIITDNALQTLRAL